MWVKFPEGVTEVSVQRQNFQSEFSSKKPDGMMDHFCRVPDHFMADLSQIGFAGVERPEGSEDIPDLPTSQQNEALQAQNILMENLKATVEQLTTDLAASNAALATALHKGDEMYMKLNELQVKVSDLEEENQELRESLDPGTVEKVVEKVEIARKERNKPKEKASE